MINESLAKQYCRDDITLIKNYAEAIADKTRTWICHHRNAEPFTGFCRKDLKKMNMYYQRPASELMFVTRREHNIIHNKGKTVSAKTRAKMSEVKKGKHHSAETIQKMAESHKGKHFSDEHRQKLSVANKGKQRSEESRKKISESRRIARC